MKKILTLLVMFLTMWSIAGAQTPVFGYQAVVRTLDNELVENTPTDVTISVLNGGTVMYSESHAGMITNGLGMLDLLVGNGTVLSGSLEDVDWAEAVVRSEIAVEGGETVIVETEVLAAPYALQAVKTTLTTERIVQYVQDPSTTVDDYAYCMAALGQNVPESGQMWQLTRNRIINYIMNHREIARQVAVAYLENGTAEDVQWVYNKIISTGALDEAVEVMAEFSEENRDFAKDVFLAYLESVQPSEANELLDAIMTPAHEPVLINYLKLYAKTHRNRIISVIKAYFQSASATEVTSALSVFNGSGMKQKYIDELLYSHLDSYLNVTNNLDENQIKARVNSQMDGQYLKKNKCGGTEDVDICDIRDKVNEMMGH